MPRGGISRQRLKTQFRTKQGSSRIPKFPSRLREGLGWVVSTRTEDFVPEQNQVQNLIRSRKSARRIFTLTFRNAEHIVSKIYRVKHIAPKAYRVPQAPKNDVRNAEQTSFRALKIPVRLRKGLGKAVSTCTKDFAPKRSRKSLLQRRNFSRVNHEQQPRQASFYVSTPSCIC